MAAQRYVPPGWFTTTICHRIAAGVMRLGVSVRDERA